MRQKRETKSFKQVENFPYENTGTEGDSQSSPLQEVTTLPVSTAVPNRPRTLPWLPSSRWLRWTVIGVVSILVLAGALFALQMGRSANKNRASLAAQNSATRFNALQLPLDEFITEGALAIGDQNRTLTVNGQLKANNTLLIAPTPQPSQAAAGQIYFDKTSNQLAYFNGTQFVNIGQQQTNVASLGGGSGVIGLGGGLALAGGALTNVGVLSVQGQTGDVAITAGNGIDVTGTTITNIGVISFGGQNGDVEIGAGLSASGGSIRNSGVLSVAAGTPNLLVANDGDGNLTVSSVGGGSGTVTSSGGTAGRIAKFTTSQNIEDSLLSEAAGTITVNGNLAVTGLAANGVLVGNGASAISSLAAGGAGLCFMSNVGAPSWQACPGSGGVTSLNGATGVLSIANATQAGGVITLNNASTSAKGIAQFNATNFTVASGVVNTIQNINTTANPTFAGINTTTITPNGTPLTVGSAAQDLTLQGSNILLSRINGANTTSLSFSAPTANVTYRLQTAAAGTYDVCTTAGNCVGVGGTVSTSGGTTNRLAKFTGSQTLGDSLISDNGTLVTIGGNLSVTGTVTLTTPLAVAQGGTGAISSGGARTNLGAAASGANNDITSLSGLTTALSVVQGGSGATSLTANGVLLGNGTSPISSLAAGGSGLCLISTAGAPSWQACPGGGGGGVTSLNSLTGALTLANSSGLGSTVTIDNASTSQKGIASFNSTNFSVSSGAVTTIQDIHIAATPTFGTLMLSSSQATSPMLLVNNTNGSATGNLIDLQLNGASRLAVTPAGNMTLSGTLNGQTISSAANFTGSVTVAGTANLNGGATVVGTLGANTITPSAAMTIGATAQNITMQGAAVNITSTNAGNTTSLAFQTPTANVTYRLQTAAAGTYDICTTVGNCAGVGGGVTTSGGTTNRLAKFTGSQVVGDSIITDNGSTVTIGGTVSVNTLTPSAALTIGATAQDLTLQGAGVALTATNGGITNTLTFATPATSNKTITIPNASGTVAVSVSGPLQLDSSGNITCPLCVTSGGGGGGAGAVDSLNSLTGDVVIANANGSGATVTINDASTSQKGIAQFNSTNFSASSGTINTIQDINTTAAPTFGRLAVTSSQATNDMFVVNNTNASGTGALLRLQLNGANRFTVDPAGNVVAAGTLTSGNINGQTISSTANFTGSVTVAGTLAANTITPNAAMTVGATTQNLTLQGAVTSITSTNAGSTTALNFQTPTANVTYRLLTAAAGTYDVCTTAGNCAGVGGGVTTSGGTPNAIPKFTSSQGISDSNISDDGSTVAIAVDLSVNTITPTAAMVIGSTGEDLTLQGANVAITETSGGTTNTLGFATPSGGNKTITLPNASGTVAVSASGALAIDAAGNITCATCLTGSAVTSLNGQTGAVTVANASGAGGTVTINDASTSQKGIAQFNSTNFSASGGTINTIQDINTTAAPTFGRLTVTSNQASSDMLTINNTNTGAAGSLLKLQLNSADRFTVDAAGNVVAAGTITSGNINGQTISSAANFTGSVAVGTTLSVNTITPTGAMTVGATNQNLTLQGATTAITSTSGANTTTLSFQTPTANVMYRLLTTTAGTYDICTSSGNCAGVGGGVTTSGGSTNRLAKFTGSQTLGDSLVSDDGTTVGVTGNLSVSGGSSYSLGSSGSGSVTSSGAITITAGGGSTWSTSSGALTLTSAANMTLNATGTLSVGSSNTSTLNFGSASNNTRTINIGTAGTSAAQTVNIGSGGTSTSTTTIQGGTGATAVSLAAAAGGSISSTVTGAGNINFNTAASIFAKASTNSTSTFQVQNAATRGILTVDTSNSRTILGNITSTLGQGVAGSLVLADGTNDNFGLTLNTTTLTNNRTITLPDASGTVCLQSSSSCGFAASSGSTSYIQNGIALQSNANIAIESAADSSVSLRIRQRSNQSVSSLLIQDANNTDVFKINEYGALIHANGAEFQQNVGIGIPGASTSGVALRLYTNEPTDMGIQIYGDTGQTADLFEANANDNAQMTYAANGSLILTSGSGQSAPLLRLNESGGSAVLTVEPDGDVDIDGVYKVNGTSGSTVTCGGGQFLQNLTASGGIVTGGTCASAGGGTNLQQAYTASTGSTTPEIKLDSTRGALDIQDADSTISANLFNIRAANGSGLGAALLSVGNTGQVTSQNSSNSTTAFRVLTQGGASMFTIDTTNSRAYVGDPTADSTGALLVLDTKNTAGDPTGVAGAMYYNSTMGRMRCFMENTWRFCNDPSDLRWGYVIQEEFAANANIGALGWRDASIGTGSVTAQIADVASRPGQTRLSTGGSGTGAIFFDGSTDSGTFFIQGGEEIEFSLKINNLATSGIDYDVRAGLCDLMDAPCNGGVFIEYNRDQSVNWRFSTAGSVSSTVTNSSKAVATGWTSFRIVANSTSSIDFYAKHESDSAYVLLGNITTNIPTTQGERSMGMVHISKALDAGTGTTDRFVDVDYFGIRNSFTSPR